ncbi:YopX family protein [Fructobacillus cardui]|uniref:YopX family protein n=1 Tax=Fructobacillus cardui TaxID=2893170 RepID=UPI00200A889B|nr:YopX family protein [Fructobacillus cardui]MCK8628198.1 YopX family protein [Fructobacillus cardui]
MREIKFRAWDEKRKHYIGNWEYVINPDDGKVLEQVGYDPEYEKFSVNYNAVAEQYTGLHDKNGNEIYEGDIVNLHVVVLSPDDKVGYIEYRPKFGYCINFGKSIARQEYWASNDKHTIEVIGNIHDNPELLEEK